MKSSYLVLVDGISGAGKGTQLEHISSFFTSKGSAPLVVDEPSDFLKEVIHRYRQQPEHTRDAEVEALLFTADRKQLYSTTIKPALDSGMTVLSDRSFLSTLAYQSLLGVDTAKILEMNSFYPRPDLALIFLCEPSEAVRRIVDRERQSGKPRTLDERVEKITALKESYERIAPLVPNTRIVYTDGSVNAVRCQAESHLKGLLGITMEKAVFLDKDGTLVDNSGYPQQIPSDGVQLEHTLEGLQRFKAEGYRLFIVSNQPWISKRKLTREQVEDIFQSILGNYKSHGVVIDGYYYCPHQSSDLCECKKPQTGLFEKVTEQFNIDTRTSYMVGDMAADIVAGRNFGLRTCLVRTGEGHKYNGRIQPDYTARNVNEFAGIILHRGG